MSTQFSSLFGSPAPKNSGNGEEGHWMSVSDLMAGLMIVFLFIAIAMMKHYLDQKEKIEIERDQIKEIAVTYQDNQVALYNALMQEFKNDLIKWDAEIDQNTLSFNFKSPDILFDLAKTNLKPKFKEILDNFFPRYYKILSQFESSINEIRIEGHTDSSWNKKTNKDNAYFLNMNLSQGRTRSVLKYVYTLPDMVSYKDWVTKYVAAVGFSSSKIILKKDGTEDEQRSRRVTFRVITNAETQIRKILGSK